MAFEMEAAQVRRTVEAYVANEADAVHLLDQVLRALFTVPAEKVVTVLEAALEDVRKAHEEAPEADSPTCFMPKAVATAT